MFWSILLGITCGMRTMTAIAVLCWAAYLGLLPVEGTWAFWTGKLVSVIVFTLAALGEYYGDTRASTPSRTDLPLVAGRVAFGVLTGVILATVLGQPKVGGVIFGALGALIGTYGGYRVRMALGKWVGRDLPVALTESALALGWAVLAVKHVHTEIVTFADKAMLLWPMR